LGLLAIVVAVMFSFGLLGLWQLNVARDKGRAQGVRAAPARPVVDVAAVLTPQGPFPQDGEGRRITAKGRYDGSAQVLVTPRRLRGDPGYWVVTPLVVRSTGARIAVVRGFVTDPTQAVKPDVATEVTVSGTLAPGESPADGTGLSSAVKLPDGQLAALDLSLLVNRWPGSLYNAFVFATAEQPDVTSVAAPAVAAGASTCPGERRAHVAQRGIRLCSGGSSRSSPRSCGGGWSATTMKQDDYETGRRETGRRETGKATNV